MLYVIPFILLLVILIFLKKREASQKEPKTGHKDKTSAKKAGKKTAKSGTPATDELIQADLSAASQSTPLAADLRQKLEHLIQTRNFFAAEAQINQALNRDSSQHELYLLLLDIHTQQKDEFAINQLMGQLHALGLKDILQKAEAKQQAYLQKKEAEAAVQATLASQPVVTHQDTILNTARSEDFDALVKPTESSTSFEQIQAELVPAKKEQPVEVAPLEFNLSGTAKAEENVPVAPVVETPAVDLSKALDFTLESSTATAVPVVETPAETAAPEEKTEEPKPLEFSFTLAPTETAETESEVKVPEVSIAAESVPLIAETVPSVETESKAETAPDFNLDFPSFDTSTAEQTGETVTAAENLLEAAPAIPSTFEFTLETPAISSPAVETMPAVESEPASTVAMIQPAADQHEDPLAQSFPELLQVNEITLNLQLAEQYIQLGAYASARRLLAESEAQFSPEQREQSDALLKQIAS